MRYIDADWIIQKLERWRGQLAETYGENDEYVLCLGEVLMKLDDAPTADIRENVRGEWLPHPNKSFREWDVCSACGTGCKRREYGIHANGKKWLTEYNYPFCPNCGAEMGGDNNGKSNEQ